MTVTDLELQATWQPISPEEQKVGSAWVLDVLKSAVQVCVGDPGAPLLSASERVVVICGSRPDGSKCSYHYIFPAVVVDAPSTSGKHLCAEIGVLLLIACLEHLRLRPIPRAAAPSALDTFIIRLCSLHDAEPRSFAQLTALDMSVYKCSGLLRTVGSSKVSHHSRLCPISGEDRWTYRLSVPLQLESRCPLGLLVLNDLRDGSVASRALWLESLVNFHAFQASSTIGMTSAPGDLVCFQSSYFTSGTYETQVKAAFGAGSSPAVRVLSGLTSQRFKFLLGPLWFAILPDGPAPWRQRARPDYVPRSTAIRIVSIPSQPVFDTNLQFRHIRDIGHREVVYCISCDVKHGRPVGDASAVTTVKSDGSMSIGYYCFACNYGSGQMWWMSTDQAMIKPLDGITSFRPVGNPARAKEFLADVVKPADVFKRPLCAISAQTGAGKTFFFTLLIKYLDSLPPSAGVFKVRGKAPWLIIVFRISLADYYFGKLGTEHGKIF